MPRKKTSKKKDNLELEFDQPSMETEDANLSDVELFNLNTDSGHIDDMFSEWFLDYASYVILERAVPHADDGLKPVQRRILHSMRELEDGRYNKVANLIGNTMKYHPHGDASIGDAMVQLGQKELLSSSIRRPRAGWPPTTAATRSPRPSPSNFRFCSPKGPRALP